MKTEIDFQNPTNRINDVLFAVERHSVFAGIPSNLFGDSYALPAKDNIALVNKRDQQVLSIVSKNYRLITNEEALEIGKKAFRSLFPSIITDHLIPFKVIAPRKLTSCHIDLVHQGVNLEKIKQDSWFPFLRITNSYNRTYALSFELGFVRALCSNGFIFDKKSVKVKYRHTAGSNPYIIEADVSKLVAYEAEFVGYLNNLKRFYIDKKYVLPLLLKALNMNYDLKEEPLSLKEKNSREKFSQLKGLIEDLTDQYFNELNPTAYAFLNILTDFISHQDEYKMIPMYMAHVNHYYNKPSHWMISFVDAIKKDSFDIEDYLGTYKIYLN